MQNLWQFRVVSINTDLWINEDDWLSHILVHGIKFTTGLEWSNCRLMIVCRDWFEVSGICPLCYEPTIDIVLHFEDHLTDSTFIVEVDIDDREMALIRLRERGLARKTNYSICHCGRIMDGHVCALNEPVIPEHIDCVVCNRPIRPNRMQYHLFICQEAMDLSMVNKRNRCRMCFCLLTNHSEANCICIVYNILRMTQKRPCCFLCMQEVVIGKYKAHIEKCSKFKMRDLNWDEIKAIGLSESVDDLPVITEEMLDSVVSLPDDVHWINDREFVPSYRCYCGVLLESSMCLYDHCKTHRNTTSWNDVIGHLFDRHPDVAIRLMDNNNDELEEL